MNNQDYEQKKREYLEEFCKQYRIGEPSEQNIESFNWFFDRAYALGKQDKDAEGEKMLYVKAKTVREMYAANERLIADYISDEIERQSAIINETLRTLFGSKCLPDEPADEVNFASKEPKFKIGDKVKVYKIGSVYNGAIGEIIDLNDYGSCFVLFPDNQAWFRPSALEPYTEPTESNYSEKLNSSDHIADPGKMIDGIIKDGFRDHNRLHIAAMAMQSVISNTFVLKQAIETGKETFASGEGLTYRAVAKAAFLFADALIEESQNITEES